MSVHATMSPVPTTKPVGSISRTPEGTTEPSRIQTEPLDVWSDIASARDRAESEYDLREIWHWTVREIALRYRATPNEANIGDQRDDGLLTRIGAAIRIEDRVAALLRIEWWRATWIGIFGQADLTSTARLNVIDSLRRARGRIVALRNATAERWSRRAP